MPYKIGLDIGTASCALVALSLDAQGEPLAIVHHALYIFPEPLLPPKAGGVGEPKKAARRRARMARRIIERRARRLRRVAHLAALIGLDRQAVPPDPGQALHSIRAKAAVERVELADLLRVMLKLAKRRGYPGAFRVRREGEEGPVQAGISALRDAMHVAGCKTLGAYLNYRFERGETLKLKEAGLYAHRDMLIEEFNAIWSEQQRHHPVLRESRPDPLDPQHRTRPIRDQFFDAIFMQRPIRSVAAMVGHCALEPSLPRAPAAQPAFQAFRIEKQLADLRWGMGRAAVPLSAAQREAVRTMLNDPDKLTKEGKLSFAKIYTELARHGLMPQHRRSLNMERSSREELVGNRTLRVFKELGLLDEWHKLDRLSQIRAINFLADLGSPEELDQPDWHERFVKATTREPRQLDPNMVAFIERMVASGKFDRLSSMGFDSGRASYSIRALEKLSACMKTDFLDEHEAIRKCYPPEAPTGVLLPRLPQHKPTGNVVVDVALGAVKRAVNEALETLGRPPAEVVVELSRDMALGVKARSEIEKKIDRNRRQRENARKELVKHGQLGTDRNVLRYLLWQEQDTHCPYCGNRISLEQAVDGNATNMEHILPRSLTRIGRQRSHLVLAHRACNDLKGDRTPFEAFGRDTERWSAVRYCASVLQQNRRHAKARLLLIEEYDREVLDDESIQEFSQRQFAETSWIAKLVAQWMRTVCPRVSVSRGTLTAHLRRIWKLDTVIPQARYEAGLPVLDTDGQPISASDFERFKAYWEGHTSGEHPRTDRKIDKRIDHRHHLIDALVVAQVSVSLYQRMAREYKALAEQRQSNRPVRLRLQAPPPLSDVRNQALDLVRNAVIHHKPDRRPAGAFFQDTAYSKKWTEDGKSRLAVRVNVIDLADKAGSVDRTRRAIADIVSPATRRIVLGAFEARISAGKSAKEALCEPIADSRFGARDGVIKKVRVYQRLGRGYADGSSALPIRHVSRQGTLWKHYVSDGYAYVAIASKNGRIVCAESVSLYAASRRGMPGDGEVRFYRGDTLRDPRTGQMYLIHQILANATVRAAPLTEARVWIDLGSEAGAVQFGATALASMERS